MNYTIKPLNDRLLVLPDAPRKMSKGGLEIPDVSMERPVMGTIIAVGGKCQDRDLREGVRVLYGKFSGSEMQIEQYEFVMLREDEIMGVELESGAELEDLVETVREELAARGLQLKTEREGLPSAADLDAAAQEQEIAERDREPLECPYCFKKFTDRHSCAKHPDVAFLTVMYETLKEHHNTPL